MTVQTPHPPADMLEAFGRGRLSEVAMDFVAEHVAGCDSCCQRLRSVGDDTLAMLARDAASDSVLQTAAEPGHTRTAGGSAPPAFDGSIPPELADHPRYRVLGVIGAGGMGVVYKAEHRMMERLVALKVLHPNFTAHPQAAERFRTEVRAAARLSHANIVTAHDADSAGALHFFVMEFIEGVSVDRLVASRPLPVATACHFARQAALALAHMHERGMIHRDIKPQNLMVQRGGVLKVLDCGLARLAVESYVDAAGEPQHAAVEMSGASHLTTAHMMLGTPDYIAPEQADDPRAADPRSDLYSLGCTLYFLLTGRPPFDGGRAMDKLAQHRQSPVPSVQALRPDVPAGVAQIVAGLMAKRPEDRPANAAKVAELLAPFAKGGDASTPLLAEPTAPPIALPPAPLATTLTAPVSPTVHRPPSTDHLDLLSLARRHWIATSILGVVLIGLAALGISRMLPPGDGGGDKPLAGKSGAPPSGGFSSLAQMPKVVLVLPQQNFWDDDYNRLRPALEAAGAKVRVVSSAWKPATGVKGTTVRPDAGLSGVAGADADAIVFFGTRGGQGNEFTDDPTKHAEAARLASDFAGQGKTVAAICAGTAVLAKAGLLRGRQATGSPTVQQAIQAGGATYIDDPSQAVVLDGPFLTARNYEAAEWLAERIVAEVKKRKSGK